MFDQAVNKDKKPYLYRAALTYYTGYLASQKPFVEVFNEVSKYMGDPERCWSYTLRVKRGMKDSSQPGGLYKD